MKKIAMLTLSLVVLASSNAFAQEKTRAQVYQELVTAEQNGSNLVTDESYPDISPVYTQEALQLQARFAKSHGTVDMASDGMPANPYN